MPKKMPPPEDPSVMGDFNFDQLTDENVVYLPTKDRILVKPDIRKTSIILPGGKQMLDNPIVKVIAVGPGTNTITGEIVPLPIKVGDRALIAYSPATQLMPLKIDGEVAFLISFHDVLSIVEDKPKAEA